MTTATQIIYTLTQEIHTEEDSPQPGLNMGVEAVWVWFKTMNMGLCNNYSTTRELLYDITDICVDL